MAFSDGSFSTGAFSDLAWLFGVAPPPAPATAKRRGAAGPEADFRRRRAEVVVNGRVREVATTEDARRIIAAHVEKAKQKAKALARTEPDALPAPPVVQINYAGELPSLARMVEEANARIEQMYAQAFARAIARQQEDEDEIAVLLLH